MGEGRSPVFENDDGAGSALHSGAFWSRSDLRRWGRKLAERGGKNAKKRAVVAVARKLAVLLHRLWVSGEAYEPLRNSQRAMQAVA
jgi:hypothetical protein